MRARLLYCTHYCSPVVITLTDVYLVAAPLSHRSYNKEQVLHCVMDALHCTALHCRAGRAAGADQAATVPAEARGNISYQEGRHRPKLSGAIPPDL